MESAATADIAYGGTAADRGRPVPLEGAGVGRRRAGVRLERTGPLRGRIGPNGWLARLLDRPEPHPEGRHPALRGGPGRPGGQSADPGSLPAPGLYRGQPVASARLYVTALGLYEARLNGRRVGDGFLTPGWTDYARRIAYQTYDVTQPAGRGRERPRRDPGRRVVRRLLRLRPQAGRRPLRRRRPELLAQLVLRLADGSEQRIVTDGQWQSSAGAIRHADLLMGERHDLTRRAARLGPCPASTHCSTGSRSRRVSATAPRWSPTRGRRSGSPRRSPRAASPRRLADVTSSTSART